MSNIIPPDYSIPHPYKDASYIQQLLKERLGDRSKNCGSSSSFETRLIVGECFEAYVMEVLTAMGFKVWKPKQNIKRGDHAKRQVDLKLELPNGEILDIEVKSRDLDGNLWKYGTCQLCPTRQYDLKAVQPEITFLVEQTTGEILVTWVPKVFWVTEESFRGPAYSLKAWMVTTLEGWVDTQAYYYPQLLPDHPASAKGLEFQRHQWEMIKAEWEAEQVQLAA